MKNFIIGIHIVPERVILARLLLAIGPIVNISNIQGFYVENTTSSGLGEVRKSILSNKLGALVYTIGNSFY